MYAAFEKTRVLSQFSVVIHGCQLGGANPAQCLTHCSTKEKCKETRFFAMSTR